MSARKPFLAWLGITACALVLVAGACTADGDADSAQNESTGPPPSSTEIPTLGTKGFPSTAARGGMSGLHVVGNALQNGAGQPVRLLGVNRSGTESACAEGWGLFDGPSDANSVAAIKSWHVNTVRVPFNESCWLGINGVEPEWSGANYRKAVSDYVQLLTDNDLAVSVDLHWAAPGDELAAKQAPMPNRDHSIEFWTQVAAAFKDNSSVVFEPYNEPIPDGDQDTTEAWRCWRDGGTCAQIEYQVAGMQELVNAIRSTGAKNVVFLGGVQWAGTLTRWLEFKPKDPTGNVGAAWHVYNMGCSSPEECWNDSLLSLFDSGARVATKVPVFASEIGEDDCTSRFINPFMDWLDQKRISYLAWTWDTWDDCYALIKDYAGTPKNSYGGGLRSHLIKVNP
jgi:endoglucanase